MNQPPRYFVAIAGNIGVGKSSLTELIARELNWKSFLEPHAENPYLADFYADMQRWSFHSQIFFLSRRLQHHRKLVDFPGNVVQDRTVYEDAEIFATNLYLQKQMNDRDFNTYQALYEGMCAFLPPPDLVIYLKASVGTLAERISLRGRKYELQISIDYLTQLNALYDKWADHWNLGPMMVIKADAFDFVHRPGDLSHIIDKVRARLNM